MKTEIKLIVCLVLFLILSRGALYSHSVAVHQHITESAEESAYINSSTYDSFIDTVSADRSRELLAQSIIDGSAREDDFYKDEGGFRSINHFYDPLTGLGLSNLPVDDRRSPFGVDSFTWASTFDCPGINFSIAGIGVNVDTMNARSWRNARDRELVGLTATTHSERQAALDDMFREVGQVMHLLEDTTSPQHVRNEQHLPYFAPSAIENYGKGHANELNYQAPILDWKSVGFTKLQDFWNRGFLYNRGAAALDADSSGGANTLGLAEWCNGNFLGQRHIYAEYFKPGDVQFYPYPSLKNTVQGRNFNGSLLASLDTKTLENLVQGQAVYIEKDGAGIHMQHHSVLKYLGVRNAPRMAKPEMRALLTIDDENVLQEYHQYLIPRAVEYSAGLLDYYFRGTLEAGDMTDNGDGTYTFHITNTSSQDFNGGAFHLFYDGTDGVRDELTGSHFFTSYSGALQPSASITATFDPQVAATNYILIYKGTIGAANGITFDSVDANRAIALVPIAPPFEFVWMLTGDQHQPRGSQSGQMCPWPEDFLAQPLDLYPWSNEYLCDPSEQDPWRWAETEGNPVDSRSVMTQGNPFEATLYTHAYSSDYTQNGSSSELVYIRKRINGGIGGKHVAMHGDWTFPGGEWTQSDYDSDTRKWEDSDQVADMRIDFGHEPTLFFNCYNPLFANIVDVWQATPDTGVIDYEFDIPPGKIDYICIQFQAWTHGNGPSTLRLTWTVTDN